MVDAIRLDCKYTASCKHDCLVKETEKIYTADETPLGEIGIFTNGNLLGTEVTGYDLARKAQEFSLKKSPPNPNIRSVFKLVNWRTYEGVVTINSAIQALGIKDLRVATPDDLFSLARNVYGRYRSCESFKDLSVQREEKSKKVSELYRGKRAEIIATNPNADWADHFAGELSVMSEHFKITDVVSGKDANPVDFLKLTGERIPYIERSISMTPGIVLFGSEESLDQGRKYFETKSFEDFSMNSIIYDLYQQLIDAKAISGVEDFPVMLHGLEARLPTEIEGDDLLSFFQKSSNHFFHAERSTAVPLRFLQSTPGEENLHDLDLALDFSTLVGKNSLPLNTESDGEAGSGLISTCFREGIIPINFLLDGDCSEKSPYVPYVDIQGGHYADQIMLVKPSTKEK